MLAIADSAHQRKQRTSGIQTVERHAR
jgi:hypothetical protein